MAHFQMENSPEVNQISKSVSNDEKLGMAPLTLSGKSLQFPLSFRLENLPQQFSAWKFSIFFSNLEKLYKQQYS